MSINSEKFVIITPLCNEEANIAATIDSMLRQTIKPLLWIIVDDGSTDNSLSIIWQKVEVIPWIKVIERHNKGYVGLDFAEEVHAFNEGYKYVKDIDFEYIGKFDGDITLDSNYFESMLCYLRKNPKLGIVCGSHWMITKTGYKLQRVLNGFVWGPVKFYRRKCFEDINCIEHCLGWDSLDVVRARVNGWQTQAYITPRFFHNKPMGSRGGVLRGKFRYGRTSYFLGYNYTYFFGRLAFQFFQPPYFIGSLAMLAGYLKAFFFKETCILSDKERFELRCMQKRALFDSIRFTKESNHGYLK